MFEKSVPVPERDKRAEVITRLLDSAKYIQAFHGKKFGEVFQDEQSKREFLAHLSKEDFIALIDGINGILRGKKKEEWRMDGGDVALVPGVHNPDNINIPPREEDKLGLFGELHEGMRIMIEDKRGIDDIALLLASCINEIHSYEDANGRTSRLVYTLLTESFDDVGKEKTKNILGEDGRLYVDINPGLIGRERDDIISREIGLSDSVQNPENVTNLFDEQRWAEMTFQDGVTDDMKKSFRAVYNDLQHGLYAAFKLIAKLPNRDSFLRAYTGRSVILIGKLASELNKDQMDELIEEYWALKKRKAEMLIDLIIHPDKPEYQMYTEAGEMNLLDYFKIKIKKEQEKNKELL